jgi:hypothetical protein
VHVVGCGYILLWRRLGLYNMKRWGVNNNDHVAIINMRGVCDGDGIEDELVFNW